MSKVQRQRTAGRDIWPRHRSLARPRGRRARPARGCRWPGTWNRFRAARPREPTARHHRVSNYNPSIGSLVVHSKWKKPRHDALGANHVDTRLFSDFDRRHDRTNLQLVNPAPNVRLVEGAVDGYVADRSRVISPAKVLHHLHCDDVYAASMITGHRQRASNWERGDEIDDPDPGYCQRS